MKKRTIMSLLLLISSSEALWAAAEKSPLQTFKELNTQVDTVWKQLVTAKVVIPEPVRKKMRQLRRMRGLVRVLRGKVDRNDIQVAQDTFNALQELQQQRVRQQEERKIRRANRKLPPEQAREQMRLVSHIEGIYHTVLTIGESMEADDQAPRLAVRQIFVQLKNLVKMLKKGILTAAEGKKAESILAIVRDIKDNVYNKRDSQAWKLYRTHCQEYEQEKKQWKQAQEIKRHQERAQEEQKETGIRMSPQALEREYEMQQEAREQRAAAERRAMQQEYSSADIECLGQEIASKGERLQEYTRNRIAQARQRGDCSDELKSLMQGLPSDVTNIIKEDLSSFCWWLDRSLPIKSSVFADNVGAVALSKDGSFILIQPFDTEIVQKWDVKTHTLLQQYKAEKADEIAISPDNHYMIMNGNDWAIIRSLETGKKMRRFILWRVAAMTGNNKYVVTSKRSQAVMRDMISGKTVRTFSVKDDESHQRISAISISENNNVMAIGYSDYTVRIWDLNTGALLHLLAPDLPKWHIGSLAISPDGQIVVAGNDGGLIRIWDVQTGRLLNVFQQKDSVTSVALSQNNDFIVSGSSRGKAYLWDTHSLPLREPLHTFSAGSLDTWVAISADDRFIVTKDVYKTWPDCGTVRIWRPDLPEKMIKK